jgi:hypothetical protein
MQLPTIQWWAIVRLEDYGLKESILDKDNDLFLSGSKMDSIKMGNKPLLIIVIPYKF